MAAPVTQGPTATKVDEDTLSALAGFSISDADDTTLLTVRFKVSHGALSLDPVLGAGAVFNSSHRQFDFHAKSIAEINAALATLKYQPDPEYSGPDKVLIGIYDRPESSIVSAWYAIDVRPVNDAPVITSNGGSISNLMAIVEGNTALTKVVATDIDGDRITYKIAGGEDADKVKIDPKTGKLSFIKAPDFLKPTDANLDNFYRFTVEATDGKASDKQVFIVAVDQSLVNKAPVITSDGGGPNAALTIPENTTAVTQVLANDPNANTKLKFSIAGGPDAGKFEIDAASGVLSFRSAPDFDNPTDGGNDNVYDLTVKVSDGKLDALQSIAVTVADVEQAPLITSDGGGESALIHHQEGVAAVTTVTATDADAGDTITYSILGGDDAARFAIDPDTGALSFIDAPVHGSPTDANGDNVYQVIVGASDGKDLDYQTLTIDIDDAAGVVIVGTKGHNKVNVHHTVKGQPNPTEFGDIILGLGRKDRLSGLDGDDALLGGYAGDKMWGGDGDDILVGGHGNNILKGGAGADFFVFDWKLQREKFSKIKDFKPAVDVLALDHDHFRHLGAGQLPDEMLRVGAKARDDDDRIIYNRKTGEVSDVDGKGGKGALHFATIDKKLDLGSDDILVV